MYRDFLDSIKGQEAKVFLLNGIGITGIIKDVGADYIIISGRGLEQNNYPPISSILNVEYPIISKNHY